MTLSVVCGCYDIVAGVRAYLLCENDKVAALFHPLV